MHYYSEAVLKIKSAEYRIIILEPNSTAVLTYTIILLLLLLNPMTGTVRIMLNNLVV